MRVTGGVYCGRRVVCPPGVIRPAMDRMRESIFAILGDLTGASFLDLYSGSGIVGIEAASRGATAVTLVERDRRKIGILKENTRFVESELAIICLPVERFLTACDKTYDLIFADPPFAQRNRRKILGLVVRRGVLAKGGFLMIHHPAEDPLPDSWVDLVLDDERKYGRSIVKFYREKRQLSD